MEQRIERITEMERYLDEAAEAVAMMNYALARYAEVLPHIRILEEYYTSALWREDYDAESAGKLPKDLKRGVLSEDAVYNMLCDNRLLMEELRKIFNTPRN